jgi:uncharacterized protein YggE
MNKFCFATALLLASSLPLAAQQIQISKENKTIAITTSDEASALADTAIVSIGFTAYGKDQDSTYADSTKISNAIIAALTASGVKKDAIQSSNQNLASINPNSDEDKARYMQGMRFTFSQAWRVTVRAEQASDVLHIAILNGANNSGDISWQLVHDDALEAEAASKALEHARQIADQMAKGLNTKLGALVYASNQTPPRGLAALMGMNGMMVNAESASVSARMKNLKPLAISPERITKSATVYAVFAIE